MSDKSPATDLEIKTARTFHELVENSKRPAIFKDIPRQNEALDILERALESPPEEGIIDKFEHVRTIIDVSHFDSLSQRDDMLVELLKKTVFEGKVVEYMSQKSAERRRGIEAKQKEGLLILLDFDFFKRVNDEYGHNFGDKVLKNLSSAIHKSVRSTDILGRLGGEELGIFLLGDSADKLENEFWERGVDSDGEPSGLYYRINKLFHEYMKPLVDGKNIDLMPLIVDDIPTYFSAGLAKSTDFASFALETDRYDKMFNSADIALYAFKNRRKIERLRLDN